MARIRYLLLALAAWIAVSNAVPISNAPGPHVSRDRYTLPPSESPSTFRGFARDNIKRNRAVHRNHRGQRFNREPTVWSARFWMSIAARPSIRCPYRTLEAHHPHRKISPHHKSSGSKYAIDSSCAVWDANAISNNGKGTFVLLLLEAAAVCSMYLTWKVMSIAIRQMRSSFRSRVSQEKDVEDPS